jgi:ATP-dependent Zn protease
LGKPEDPHSQALLDRIEHATTDIINAQMKRACEAVDSHRESIARLVEGLMDHDTLESEEIRRCFRLEASAQAA